MYYKVLNTIQIITFILQCEKSKMEANLQQSASDTAAKVREAEQSQSQIMQDKQV